MILINFSDRWFAVRPGEDWAAFTVTMAELGANYNIQCMKLFQELKAEFPCIPDSVVRQCMKQVFSCFPIFWGFRNCLENRDKTRVFLFFFKTKYFA